MVTLEQIENISLEEAKDFLEESLYNAAYILDILAIYKKINVHPHNLRCDITMAARHLLEEAWINE